MVFNNDFVVCILHGGKVLREENGKVFLPFESDYQIRLKNLHSYLRCKATVKVDGTLIHPDNVSFVINPNDTLDIKRTMLDGDMCKGKSLRFVRRNDCRVSDPSNPENGIVEVSFYREVKNTEYVNWGNWNWYNRPWWDNPFPNIVYSCNSSSVCNGSNGATVSGDNVYQEYRYANDFPVTIYPTVIRIMLVGSEKPITVNKTRKKYCVDCGYKNPYRAKFCMNCGSPF